MPRHLTAILLCVLFLIGGPAFAQRQDSKLEPPDLENYRRWGFFRARPGLQLSNIGYDSNILSNSRGEPVSDYTATLTPGVDGLILFGSRAFLTLREQFDYTFYAENHEQNFWANSFTTRATIPFRSVGVFGQWSLDDLRWRPDDREDVRIESKRREVGVGIILQPGWRTEVELARYVNRWRYEDPEGFNLAVPVDRRLDRDESWTTLDVSYELRGRTRLLLQVENREIEFQDSLADINNPVIQRDTRESRMLAGFQLGRGSSIVGRLLLGTARIDAEDPLLQDLSETIGELDATWLAGSRTRIRFVAERAPRFAVSGSNAYYLNTSGVVRTVHYFTNLVGGELAFRRGELEFPEDGFGPTRRDEIRHDEIGIRLRLLNAADGRRVEYSFTIGRYQRDSNFPGLEYDKTTVGLGAVLGF